MADEETGVEGALIRGSDGTTYFIPSDDLAAYRVPDAVADQSAVAFDGDAEVAGFAAPGPRVVDAMAGPLGPNPNSPGARGGGGQGSGFWQGHDENSNNAIVAATGYRP